MAKKQKSTVDKPSFVPVLANTEVDRSGMIAPKSAFKLIQVVEYARLSCMWGGFGKVLADKSGLRFRDLLVGEIVMFINVSRDYIKVIMGNGTDSPVIAAYRFPKGTGLPTVATKQLCMTMLRRGELQCDARLRVSIGETMREVKKRIPTPT